MVILINGTSSSGKTAVAKELQEILGGYPLNFSIDSVLYGLPGSALKRMTTGQKNPGLSYTKLEEGFYKCARALADLGHDLVIDNAIVTPRSAKLMVEYLNGISVLMVGLTCSTDELKRRELQRGDRTIGEAESQVDIIHKHCVYDVHLDSTKLSPLILAQEIQAHIEKGSPWSGFENTKLQLQALPA